MTTKLTETMTIRPVIAQEPVPAKTPNRNLILIAGVILLASLGSVYAWSFFTKPLQEQYLWSNMQISAVFSLAVAGLGFSALYTGPLVHKIGSRLLMKRASIFFVSGYLIAALGLYLGSGILGSIENKWISWLSYIIVALGYGVIGGIGLGTGYVTSVTTIAGWFPDKKGFATGIIVMGFGLGALFMSKIFAPISMNLTFNNITLTFLIIAAVYAVIMSIAFKFIYSPNAVHSNNRKPTIAEIYPHGTVIRVKLWMICFLYSVAGLGIISLLSPLMQSVKLAYDPTLGYYELAAAGATLIAMASIGNSIGRLFWAWLSDIIGRIEVFVIMLGTSAIAFMFLPFVTSPVLFAAIITYSIASYGGGFGTIPSLISDLFGPKRMSAIHGLVLAGWATAGLVSPTFFGYLNDVVPDKAANYSYYICAGALMISTIIVFTLKPIHKECIKPA